MNYESQLSQFKSRSINTIFNWSFWLLCVAMPLSLSRWFVTGFLFIYVIHIIVSLLAIGLFAYRKRVAIWIIEWFLIACCFSIGIGATITFGFSATTVSMFMLLLLLLSINRVKRIVFALSGLYLLCIGGVGYLYAIEYFSPDFELYQTLETPLSWFFNLLVMVIAGFSAVNALLNIFTLKNELLETITAQNKEIEFLANHDNLTGLPTLRLAEDRLELAIMLAKRNNSQTFILFLDLDGFKQVNDTLGHDIGDEVLKVAADSMLAVIRATDTCCRIGGDEFLVIIPDVSDRSAIERICENLITEISQPLLIKEHTVNIGVSIGGASYPNDATDQIALKKCADARMYEVKKSGKNNYLLGTST